MATVRELSKPGRALAPSAPTATTKNPDWWFDGAPTPARDRLHRRLIDEARAAVPDVEQRRRAIILAGPPGAGKSTVLSDVRGSHRDKYLVVDADEFKRSLLREAQVDGSYESWLVPVAIHALEAAGERFYPLELASLVHEESSYLAKAMLDDAIAAGDNIVIDTVLSSERTAVGLGYALDATGYDIRVIDLEVPYEISEQHIRQRWERAYSIALEGGDFLGGRWVPSEYACEVFAGPGGQSKPEAAARALAERCPAVSRYRVFRATATQLLEPQVKPAVEVDMLRFLPGGPLVDSAAKPQNRAVEPRPKSPGRSSTRSGPELS